MKNVYLAVLLVFVIFVSCRREREIEGASNYVLVEKDINMESRESNFDKWRREKNAHTGHFYATVDSVATYGLTYEYVIPDSLKNRNLKVYISFWMRETKMPIQGSLAVSLNNSEGIKEWHTYTITNNSYKLGEWEKVEDSVSYSKKIMNEQFLNIGIVAVKFNGADVFDIDDLKIKYKFFK